MIQKEKDTQSILKQISNILLINGGFLKNPGLYAGEMGLVLFFFHYSRYTQNDLYADYGFELLEKIQNGIHQKTSINYRNGLAGIGSAVEYLVQNDFIEADTDEILEDFDQRIFFSFDLSRLSIEEIKDVGYYAAWRIFGTGKQKDMIKQTVQKHSIIPDLSKVKDPVPNYLAEKTYNSCIELFEINLFPDKEIVFQNGLACLGMSLLTELSGDDSWISLFPYNF